MRRNMRAVEEGGEVPGMAAAVEKRRKDLRLSPGAFADAAGLTRQALAPVRAGLRRGYQDVTINGVAEALRWERDWYDRLLAGKKPLPRKAAPDVDVAAAEELAELRGRVTELEAKISELLRRAR